MWSASVTYAQRSIKALQKIGVATIGDLAKLGPHLYSHVPGEDELIAVSESVDSSVDKITLFR